MSEPTARQIHDWLVEWGTIQTKSEAYKKAAIRNIIICSSSRDARLDTKRRVLEARTRDLFSDLSKYGIPHPIGERK